MKILIICSKKFYEQIPPIKEKLEKMGHEIELPNCYDNPEAEMQSWKAGKEEHLAFKARMFQRSAKIIGEVDAVLTLNFEKHGMKNYIGGATFLELYEAFMQGKKIFLYNDIPEGILYDEIAGFDPVVLNGDLNLVK